MNGLISASAKCLEMVYILVLGGKSGGGGSNSRRAPPDRRVFISNIPFEMKWQEVKDMFRDQVGDVTYVELFNDESDKPRGE